MKALIKKGKGPSNLVIGEIGIPKISAEEVLVKVKAGAICGSDLHIMYDRYPSAIPVVIGHEFSGVIEEVGNQVKGWEKGDLVIAEGNLETCGRCVCCTTGFSHLCADKKFLGITADGCFAEYVKVPAKVLHKIPDGVSFEEASLAEPASVAIHALIEDNHIEAGDFVVILGSGPIGLLGAQVAKAVGARKVLMTGIEPDVPVRFKVAEELGVCDYLINVEKDDPVKVVKEVTRGRGADILLDATGNPNAIEQAFQMVRRKGVIAAVGIGAEVVRVPWNKMINEVIRIQFCRGYTYASFEKFCSLASLGKLKLMPLITGQYPLQEWEKGFQSMEERKSVKAILTP